MRIAYFDCFSGISGELILGALLDAGLSLDTLRAELSKLPLGGYTLDVQKVYRQEIAGTQVTVLDHSPGRGIISLGGNGRGNGHDAAHTAHAPHDASHVRSASDLTAVISRSLLSEEVKQRVISV